MGKLNFTIKLSFFCLLLIFLVKTLPMNIYAGDTYYPYDYAIHTRYSYYLVRKIQTALKQKKYDPGPIDGIWGPMTSAAVAQFQMDNNLMTEELDKKTQKAIFSNTKFQVSND